MTPRLKIALLILVLLLLAGLGAAIYLYNLKPEDFAKVKPDYVLTSSDLERAFEDDEASASSIYVGTVVEVTGEILTVTEGENNSLNVSLKTGSDFSSVICTFSQVSPDVKMQTGSTATIRGECTGYLMDVLLKNCVCITSSK